MTGKVINHTIITGQSLAVFNNGTSLSGTQTRPTEITYFSGSAGTRFALEKTNQWPERSFADSAAPVDTDFNVRTGAMSGAAYVNLKKGTGTYAGNTNNLAAGVNGASGATANGDIVIVRALGVIHGEADSSFGTTRATYYANLIEWLADYTTDCQAITGQTEPLVMIANQVSFYQGTNPAWALLDAHRAVEHINCLGPIYHLPTAGGPPHLSNEGSLRLGEYMGKVYEVVVTNVERWNPVAPTSIVRDGATITVDFTVPHPPLVFDTTTLTARVNKGFTYSDDESSATITDVAITGDATVEITLSAVPTGANPKLRYGPPASTFGGNLRDSDPEVSSYDGFPLRNWCCYFSDPVTTADDPPPSSGLLDVAGNPIMQHHLVNGLWVDFTDQPTSSS